MRKIILGFKPFIYGLVDPLDHSHIRYVGMAMQPNRPFAHAKNARKDKKHSHLFHWIRLLQLENREPEFLILEELQSETSRNFLGFIESCYIKSLREIGHKLTNVSDGGWGGNTGPKTQQMRDAVAKANQERIWTPEMREKQRASSLKRLENPIERAKHSHKRSVDSRKKQSAAIRGVPKSVEHAKAISKALFNHYRSPGALQEHSDAAKRSWITRRANLEAKKLLCPL